MKLNGKNIILDDDVTMTGKNLGEKLSDVVGELQSKTSKLENYLKWIYKYGGVGGSGGSGGGSSTYSLYAELAGVALAGQNISLGSAGVYTLYFKISRPEGATFSVTYEYTTIINNVATTIKKKVTLDVNNSYEYSVNLELNNNSTIFVTSVDSIYNETKQLSANYITKSYEFNIRLANNNEETLNNEIFTTTAANNGLNVFLDYEIAVSAVTTYSLSFNTFDNNIVVNGQLDPNASKRGHIKFDLIEIGGNEGWGPTEANSGYYSGQITVNINIEGQGIKTETFPFNFTLIPQDLYLLVQPVVGNIYTSEQTILAYVLDEHGNRTGATVTVTKEEYDAGKGTLYETDNDVYEYTPGNISFNLKAYYGAQTESPVEIDYYLEKDNEDPAINQVISVLRKQNSIRIYSTKTGWNKIKFQLRCQGVYYPGRTEYVTYYFYIKQSDTKIDWYNDRNGLFNYCRGDNYSNLQSFYKLTTGAPYQQTVNKPELVLTDIVRPNTSGAKYNTNIALGIMYSDINSDNSTILKCIQTNNGFDTVQVEVTQNTVKIGNSTIINYYLPKTENYDEEGFNYHVLNIVSRLVSNNGTTDYYEILVYVDGKIEGASQSYSNITLGVDKLVIGKSNCMINMLEVSYLDTVYEEIEGVAKSKVEDLTVYQYYLKYKSVFGGTVSDDEVALITYVNGFTVNNNGDVYCEEDTVSNISQYVDIPTLLITVNDPNNSLKTYLDASYPEEAVTNDIEATLKWSGGKGKGALSTVQLPSNFSDAYFTITIQGSSTKTYKCKNYDLTIHNRNEAETAPLYLYSPNFSNSDPSTFLPEQTFTLKADVVDSSHSNNTSIGKFVNTITAPFDTKQSGVLRGHIKNCLDGFPVLVYLQFVRTDEITETEVRPCYFQGVYNFNLGRESFYNLGYKDSSVFCNPNGSSNLPDAGNEFIFYEVPASEDSLKDGIIVAEVQGNSPYFDFSQWDNTILYNTYNNSRETYMFGDLVNGSNLTQTQSKLIIQELVKRVSLAGGYLFGNELMRKNFSELAEDHCGYDTGYNAVGTKVDSSGNTLTNIPLNQVPNYRKHFVKTLDQGGNQIYSVDPSVEIEEGTINDLTAILGDEDNDILPWFDYRSLSEYYTICMAFGLVDSVQKNLNIKAWNGDPNSNYAKFYAAFYDMDTCLGINNKGTDVSYFAFSDYWEYNDIENASGSITPTYVTVYRDYSPKAEGDSSDFYDTASSYLFAIAKYARYKNTTETTTFWPKELWAKWRGSVTNSNDPSYGCLKSAKTFIDNYFANNLGKVPAPLINANYRNKYLVIYSTDSNQYQFSQINWEKFNGTRIAKAEDWLEGRFRILDAYFNLPDANSPIQYWEKKTGINEQGEEFEYDDYTAILTAGGAAINDPALTNDYSLKANTDIFVLQDIFSGSSNNQGSGTLNINIRAREYSPLIAEIANNIYRYLLGGEKLYNIIIPLSGTQTYKFNGSGAWTELDSINTFNLSNLQVNSKYLETLSGNASNKMTVTENSLNMPSLKTLVLSSSTYSGNLVLDGTNFPNLGSVDISRSSISLNISNSDLTQVSIANMVGSASVSITGCKSLQDINFGNTTTLTSCVINPLPVSLALATTVADRSFGAGGFQISNTKISSLSLTNSENTSGRTRLYISNDEELTTLSVSGFATVYITNCPKLTNIYITDPQNNNGVITGDYLEKLFINSCGINSSGFKIGSAQTPDTIADLSAYSELKYLRISNCSKLTEAWFINNSDKYIELAPYAFQNDTNLKFIKGNSSLWITGPYTFYGCRAFTLKVGGGTSDPMSRIWVRDYVTDLSNTFYISGGGGAITRAVAKSFIEGAISQNNSITNISSMFGGQSISYTGSNLITDLKGQTEYYIDMSRLKKVTNAQYAFGWNNISAWHKKWHSFGSSVSSINFSSYMITGSRTILTTLDVYEDIIDKVDILGWQYSSGDAYPELQFTGSNGINLDDVNLVNFFHPGGKHPSRCHTLRYMDFSNIHNLNLGGMFGNWTSLSSIERFMFKREYTKCSGLNMLLSPLTNLKYVKDSFRISANNVEPAINLATFCNWSALKNSSYDPFQSRTGTDGDYNLGNFTIQKYITADDFVTLIGNTIGNPSCNWTGISNLFRNCTILTTSSDEYTLSLGNNVNSKIKAINGTFYNFRVVRVDGEIDTDKIPEYLEQESTYVTLSDNLLRIFPKLTSAGYTFYGMKIANQLPYDFFGKRYLTTNSNIYVMDSTIPDDSKNKYEESEYEDYFIPAVLYNYDYRRELENLRYCFKYTKWKQDTANNINARSFYPTIIDENRIVLSDGSGTVEKTEGLYYFTKVTETTYDSEGNPVSITYFKRNNVPLRRSTEITDTYNLEGDYAKSIIGYGYGHEFTNYDIYADALTRCFVAPDIMYGVTSFCNIDGVFDNTGGDENLETLEGIIPANLLKNCMSSSFPHLMRNLNIIPNLLGRYTIDKDSYNIYYYVPENFTSATTLDSAFDFHFLLPRAKTVNTDGATTYYKHYLLLNSSITSDARRSVSSIDFGTPSVYYNDSVAGKGLFVETPGYGWPNTHVYDYGIYYNLMFTPSYNIDGSLSGGEDGIDMTSYSALNLDNLVPPIISFFMSGRLFNSSFYLNNAKKTIEGNYIINTFGRDTNDYIVSRTIIFPNAIAGSNFGNKNIFSYGSTTLKLYSSQVSNSATNKAAYKTITIGNDSTRCITFAD